MFYNAAERKLDLHNGQIDYITFGYGTRPLIMIQGLNTRGIKGSSLMLAYMYRLFAKEYKVYIFDRRQNVDGNVTVRELASDTASAMDALGITNADVFGVSQGGMIAQYLAIDRPDLVRKTVLAVTLCKNNETVEQVLKKWVELSEQGDIKALVSDMAVKMYSDSYVKKYKPLMPLLTVMNRPNDMRRFIKLTKACLTCNTYDELYKIKCPVFVIGARQDKIVSGKASEELAEKLGCEIYMYDSLGHAAYEEASDFNQRVYDFLTGN